MCVRFVVVLSLAVVLAAPAAAGAATKTVTMGVTPKEAKVLQQQLSAEAKHFFGRRHHPCRRLGQLHSTRFPQRGLPQTRRRPESLFGPGAAASGQSDEVGDAFWFNGQPTWIQPGAAEVELRTDPRYTG